MVKEAVVDSRTRGQLMIEVDNIEGLTITSRSVTDEQEPRTKRLVGNTLKPEIEPPDTAVVNKWSMEARHTLTPITPVSRAPSPAPDVLTEQSPTSLFLGTTIPGFSELVSNRHGDMTEEVRPRVVTLVAVLIAEETDT